MSLSNPAAVPRADKDDEICTASTTRREFNSSDMEIDDDDDEEQFQVSSKRNDASNIMEFKEHGGHQGSDPLSAPERSEIRLPSKTLYVGESSADFEFCSLPVEPLAIQRGHLFENYEDSKCLGIRPAGKKAIRESEVNGHDAQVNLERKAPEDYREQHSNSRSYLVANEILCETTNLSSADGNEVISIPVRYHSGVGVSGHLDFEQNCKQMSMRKEDDKWSIKSRSSARQTSTGNPFPGAAFNSKNKRLARPCSFFARGRCVKGSSCRFIHIKDSDSNSRQLHEEGVAFQLDEGIEDAAKRSRPPSPGSTDRLTSSVRNKTTSIDDFGPSKDVRQSIGQSLPADNYANLGFLSDRATFRNTFLPKHAPSLSGSVTSLGNSYKENQKFRVSTWLASLPFDSSSSACSHGAQKTLDNGREYHTSRLSSLLQGSSPFSSFEPENFHASDVARVPLHFAEYRTKYSSDDWEPSIPFRPSFFVTFDPLSPRRQYDPLRDSIDLSSVGKRPLKFSFCNQSPSILNVAHPPTCGEFTSTGPLVPECNNDDKRTASCHGRNLEKLVDNNCYTSGKGSTTDANDGTSAVDMQNGTLAKEEISSVASHVKNISKISKIDTDRDGRRQRDVFRCKKDLEVDRVREKNETDIEHKADGDALKESKAMRHFHAALVDLIKETLKPTWRQGHLSKDAHNIIVKKAVDKVIGTIQPHQVPSTFESVKEYLSLSQPKIARLVQAYIEKYGKS